MATIVCSECGEVNDFAAEFCAHCHAFLAWDDVAAASTDRGGAAPAADEQAVATRVMPRVEVDPAPTADGTATPSADDQGTSRGALRAAAEPGPVTVPATGEPATVVLRVTNTSTIVDGYAVEAVEPPAWLVLEPGRLELLPDTDGALPVRLHAASPTLVPAQVLPLVLRVTSLAQAPAYAEVSVDVTVPVVDVPVQLRAEPSLLRLRDQETVRFTLVAESRSNRTAQLRLTGSDPEVAVTFQFRPPVLELAPGASGSVEVVATARAPEPGSEVSRALTLAAVDGTRRVETLVTLRQQTSVPVEDPPVGLEAQPSLVRVRDTTVGMLRLVADNRRGRQPAHLRLRASDPERVVRVVWSAPQLDVPPGGTAYVDARLQAPLPAPGAEVSRTITVTAEGGGSTTTTATFVQAASVSPMATLAVRTDPSVVRVLDADSATTQVVLDNRRGRSGLRVVLAGSDPERAIRFGFPSPTVDVGPGRVVVVPLRLDARRPQPGQEVVRPFTITASDGDTVVEGSGSWVQAASRSAIETLAVSLDPALLRLGSRRHGVVGATLDNRRGTQPVRVTLRGDDPENSLRFAFDPPVLDVPPGRLARSAVTVRAPGAPGGRELTRPYVVVASDGRSEAQAEGSLVQAAAERRPLARVLLTLLGALGMVVGAFLTFWSGTVSASGGGLATAADLDARTVLQFFADAELRSTGSDVLDRLVAGAARVVSVGAIMVVLGVVAAFGLTGRTGRLTRAAAFLGAVVVVLTFVAFAVGGVNGGVGEAPGLGALTLAAGCVAAYVGGLLVRR